MLPPRVSHFSFVSALLAAVFLSACGGGGGSDSSSQKSNFSFVIQEFNSPAITGNTATDGLNWFNFRRQQLGLSVLVRNPALDTAAQNHSNYQALNDTITHTETVGKQGFTGVTSGDRLAAAGYYYNPNSYAYGEVISSTSDSSGTYAAEELIVAIYHRFVILEPMFRDMGGGSTVSGSGNTYFTTDFGANGLFGGLGAGNFITYPSANQQRVPHIFYSDNEIPDPVPGKNAVGFPISVHADIISTVTVQSFTVQPHGGAVLPVQLLTHATDAKTYTSVAAIIPLDPLSANVSYDVQFVGTVDGMPVSRSWSFTTQ